ncbi:MAG: hypothetical protein ABEK59_01435 [Halobacteria archaeon]
MTQLGNRKLGEAQLGGTVIADGSVTDMSATPEQSSPTASATDGNIQTATASTIQAGATPTTTADAVVQSATTSPLIPNTEITIVANIQTATGSPVQASPTTSTTAAATITSLTASPIQAKRITLNWTISSKQIGRLLEEVRKWDQLVLKVRVRKTILDNELSGFKANAEKADIVQNADGTFETVGRADGDNKHTIKPPSIRNDVRYKDTWYVERFEQEIVDQDGDKYEATITLMPDASKTAQTSYSDQTKASDEWAFDLEEAQITTSDVSKNVGQQGKTGNDEYEISMILTAKQTRIWEESLRAIGATNLRKVPDGDNKVEDNNSSDINTISVTQATNGGDALPTGTYVCVGYEVEWLNRDFYNVTATLWKQ